MDQSQLTLNQPIKLIGDDETDPLIKVQSAVHLILQMLRNIRLTNQKK